MVLAVIDNVRSTGGYWLEVRRIGLDNDLLKVQAILTHPGAGCLVTQAPTRPVHIVLLPRYDLEPVLHVADETASCNVWGDFDCDFVSVDAVDALKGLRYVADLSVNQADGCPRPGASVEEVHPGVPGGPRDGRIWGDIDCSGSLDPVDALGALRYVIRLPAEQPLNCPAIGHPVRLVQDPIP